jgi:hypothetical protein
VAPEAVRQETATREVLVLRGKAIMVAQAHPEMQRIVTVAVAVAQEPRGK